MSVTDNTKKKFIIKHIFKNIENLGVNGTYESNKEKHLGVPWKIRIAIMPPVYSIYLDCLKTNNGLWTISSVLRMKINGTFVSLNHSELVYPCDTPVRSRLVSDLSNPHRNLTVELEVKITKMSEIEFSKLRNFDDDLAKEHSDIMLMVRDQKFHVSKAYLSLHSTYFKSLFSENFAESQKSEIELKDIDPEDLQKFLEVLYGEPAIDDDTVEGILKLADMYDSKTAIKRCDEFLRLNSQRQLKEKFKIAIKYKMDELTTKCISDMNSATDLQLIVPEEGVKYNHNVWKELFAKAVSLIPK